MALWSGDVQFLYYLPAFPLSRETDRLTHQISTSSSVTPNPIPQSHLELYSRPPDKHQPTGAFISNRPHRCFPLNPPSPLSTAPVREAGRLTVDVTSPSVPATPVSQPHPQPCHRTALMQPPCPLFPPLLCTHVCVYVYLQVDIWMNV